MLFWATRICVCFNSFADSHVDIDSDIVDANFQSEEFRKNQQSRRFHTDDIGKNEPSVTCVKVA